MNKVFCDITIISNCIRSHQMATLIFKNNNNNNNKHLKEICDCALITLFNKLL